MTIAETIATQFDNDGQCFEARGAELETMCKAHCSHLDRHGDATRYVFADGSVILIAGDGWDLGFRDCWCWNGAGHDKCTAERGSA